MMSPARRGALSRWDSEAELPGIGVHLVSTVWSAVRVAALLTGFHLRARIGRAGRAIWWGLASYTIGAAVVRLAKLVSLRLSVPTEWDFLTFWLGARVAAQHLNFYDPAIYQAQALPLHPSHGFVLEILQVGYAYPPTSMLLMLPLGWFSYSIAYAWWYAASFAALGVALTVLWRSVVRGGSMGWALTAALVLAFRPSLETVSLGQTNFFVLLALSLVFVLRSRGASGAWLALGVVAKPVFVLAAPWFLLRRHWRGVAVTAVSFVLLGAATIALFGARTAGAYFRDHVVARFPHYVYAQPVNDSVLAALLRELHVHTMSALSTVIPAYLLISLVLAAITAWAAWRGGEDGAPWSLGAAWAFALLAYPSSLSHYSVALLPVLLALAADPERGVTARLGIPLVALVYALHQWNAPEAVVIARLLAWGALVALALGAARVPRTSEA
jgi:hypothetical protein